MKIEDVYSEGSSNAKVLVQQLRKIYLGDSASYLSIPVIESILRDKNIC